MGEPLAGIIGPALAGHQRPFGRASSQPAEFYLDHDLYVVERRDAPSVENGVRVGESG